MNDCGSVCFIQKSCRLGIFGLLFLFINISFLSVFGEFETNVLIINIFAKLLFIHTFVQTNI